MRRFTLLFATLLSLFWVTQVKADEITVYDGTGTNNYLPLYGYYADTKGGISEFIIPSSQLTALSGETIEQLVFYLSSPAESSFGSASFNVYLEEVVGSNYDDSSASQLTDSKTLVYTGALDATGTTMDIPFTNNFTYNGGNLLIAIEVGTGGSYKAATFYGTTTSSYAGRYKYGSSSSNRAKFIPKTTFITPTVGPALTVKDGSQKLTSPYAYNFGLATAGTSKTFTLANPGTKDLTISVSKTGDFNATLSATTITAGGEVTLTVTMPETTGSSAVTITPEATSGIDPFVINVSGTIRDANKIYEYGFTALPTDWTTTGTWSYSEANGAYNTSWYLSSNARLITPLLTISEGEVFFVEAKGYSTSNTSYQHLQMQYSADGTTWTNFDSEPTLDPSNWQTFAFTGVPAGKYYIAINASQADIRMFYGGELPNEPKMVVTQPASLDFGVITDATAKTFTIANTGKATLEDISVTSSNSTIFAVTGAPTSLEAGASAEVTITMAATTTGALSSDITVSATGMDNVAFTVTGIVLPEGMMVVDFNDNQLPAGWGNEASNKWSFSDGKAYCTSAAELTTPKLQFAEGDMLAIKITSYDNYDNNYLEITGSVDGTSWDAFTTKKYISRSQIPYGSYATLVVTDIPATVKYLKFKGYYVRIDEIAGLTYDQDAPAMAFTAADFAAGKVTESKSKTYSVANSGTGTLTVNIASDNEKFTVKPAQLVITDEAKEFTVTFNYEEGVYGKFNANITVTPTYDESAAVTFAASAQVVDPNVWAEDFEDGTLPIGWVANNWTIGTFSSYENTTKMALAPSSSTAGTLITPCLTAKEGDVLTWDAYFNWYDEAMTVEYSADDQDTWTKIYDAYKAESEFGSTHNTHKEMSFTAPADGNYYLRFTSTWQNGVDNFNGFKLNLPDHIMAITASNIPTSGSYSPSMKATQSFNATVTVKESRGIDEENVVAKLYMGEEVIGTSEATTVEAGETIVITITATPTVAATEGAQMHIEVEWAGTTLTTEAVTRYVAEFVTLALTETEKKEITTGYNAVYDQVTLTRNFAEGWNTFVAPLSVSLSEFGEGVKAYTFTGYSDGTLNFSSVSGTSLDPATPYVIYIPEAIDNKVFVWNSPVIYSSYVGEENIKTTKDGATFQGTYAPIAAPNMEGKWGVTDEGRIAQGSAAASIDGFRAYFELPATTSAPMLSIDGGPATRIHSIDNEQLTIDNAYDLSGRRVAQPSKGLYIINGKKVVIK